MTHSACVASPGEVHQAQLCATSSAHDMLSAWQALLDKLENPAGSTIAKNDARPASSKPAGKAAAKTTRQPEASSPADMSLPADLIVAARLSLSEVTFNSELCVVRDTSPSDAAPKHETSMSVSAKHSECVQRMSSARIAHLFDLTTLYCLL